jgi:outer membrane protein TolC
MQESPALATARAHVEAWARKDYDTARAMLSPEVEVTASTTAPYPPPASNTSVEEYMKGLIAFAGQSTVGHRARPGRPGVMPPMC